MAKDTKPPMAEAGGIVERRSFWGPRPVSALLPAITRAAYRKRAPAAAQLFADWQSVVGPELAARTLPRRLSAGRLTIACTGPVAMELAHQAPQLIARINAHLGEALVGALRFVQDRPAESRAALPAVAGGRAAAEAAAAAENSLAGLADGPLRAALAALGRSVHANRAIGRERISTPQGKTG